MDKGDRKLHASKAHKEERKLSEQEKGIVSQTTKN